MATPGSVPRAGTHAALAFALVLGLLTACSAPGSGPPNNTDPIDTTVIARIIVTPGSLLLTTAGASADLHATVLDANGEAVDAAVTWHSSDPNVVSVDADGTIVATGIIGSSLITARRTGVTSAPVLVVVATPRDGAVLVGDAQVITGPEPVDDDADLDLGWQYRVRLTGVPSLAPGDLVIGSGERPLGGRVVRTEPVDDDQRVTLELVVLDELFTALHIETAIDLVDVVPEFPAAITENYAVLHLLDGSFEFTPLDDGEVTLTPSAATGTVAAIDCETSGALSDIQFPRKPSFTVKPSLAFVLEYEDGLQRIGLQGAVEATLKIEPRLAYGFKGGVECNVTLLRVPIPVGGPLAFVVGGTVPVGVGFAFDGELTLAEFGASIQAKGTGTFDAGLDCRSGACDRYASGDVAVEPRFEVTLPSIEAQFHAKADLRAYGFAKLALGSRITDRLQIALTRTTFGAEHALDLRSRTAQWADPSRASRYQTRAKLVTSIGDEANPFDGLKRLLKISVTPLQLTIVDIELGRSPQGSLQVAPALVRAGTDENPGDPATFTVTLDRSTHLGTDAVSALELWWVRADDDGGTELVPARGDCERFDAPGPTTFSCETDFLEQHVGEQILVAFVDARMFGFPLPAPLLISATGGASATLRVTQSAGPRLRYDDTSCATAASLEDEGGDVYILESAEEIFGDQGDYRQVDLASRVAYGPVSADADLTCVSRGSLETGPTGFAARGTARYSGADAVERTTVLIGVSIGLIVGELTGDGYRGERVQLTLVYALEGDGRTTVVVLDLQTGEVLLNEEQPSASVFEATLAPGRYGIRATGDVIYSFGAGCPLCGGPSADLTFEFEATFEPAP